MSANQDKDGKLPFNNAEILKINILVYFVQSSVSVNQLDFSNRISMQHFQINCNKFVFLKSSCICNILRYLNILILRKFHNKIRYPYAPAHWN